VAGDEDSRTAEGENAAALLRASEARLRLALSAADLGVWDWDLVTGEMVYSRRAKEISGFSPDGDVTVEMVRKITHPEDHPVTSAQSRRALDPAVRDREPYEYRIVRPDGAVRWVNARGEAVFEEVDGETRAVRYTGTLRDITEEREREARLRDSEARLRALNATLEQRVEERTAALMAVETARRETDAIYRAYFEYTADSLFVIGVEPDGGFVVEQINPAHEATYGFKAEEIRGRRMDDLLGPELGEAVVRYYRQCVEQGSVLQYRDEFQLEDGPHHVDTVLVPLRDERGRIVRLVGSSRDVTRQVQAEDALRQAQKMEAVGQLTGGIAHDFNNLLGAVMGGFDLIRRQPADVDRVRRLAEAGLEAAERGARLTSQLLTFSRSQRLELKPVLVSELVENLADLLVRTLGPMTRLKLQLDAVRRPVMSDATQLEMAVLNLAINARDAMPDGGSLTISTALRRIEDDPELKPGEYVELVVTDTGAGMTPEVAARAFDPFFTTKGVGKGTGLGLSQVYGMARQPGGTVRLETRPGAGTSVRILLPCTESDSAQAEPAASTGASASGERVRILVVDDDADMRRMLAESLASLGHDVTEAPDGQSAIDAARQDRPDLVVLDFAMPGMNGAETARALWAEAPDLPVLFASGYAETDAIEEVGGKEVALLRKPFRIDSLQAAIKDALRPASA
jgi:PAS domain S-box-containing protein